MLAAPERANLAKDFLRSRAKSPIRPHPAAPQYEGVLQQLVGAMAGVNTHLAKPVDKVIDSRRTFEEVKYKHPDSNAA
ncbi:hypothetical protein FRC12_016589 [Ceratobasidium sp. 428]|nr:hypothetical protein FRC12_016589 [Ceratobasidium sp. 428]